MQRGRGLFCLNKQGLSNITTLQMRMCMHIACEENQDSRRELDSQLAVDQVHTKGEEKKHTAQPCRSC